MLPRFSALLALALCAAAFAVLVVADPQCDNSGSAGLRIGDSINAFMTITLPDGQSAQRNYTFKVDEMTMLWAMNSTLMLYPATSTNPGTSTVGLRVCDKGTANVNVTGFVNGKHLYAPFFTFVVNMDRGNVTSVNVQNTCDTFGTCIIDSSYTCLNNGQKNATISNCATSPPSTSAPLCTNGVCDVRIYVVWRGSDVTGLSLASINLLPQNFNKFSIGNIANNIWSKTQDFFNETRGFFT